MHPCSGLGSVFFEKYDQESRTLVFRDCRKTSLQGGDTLSPLSRRTSNVFQETIAQEANNPQPVSTDRSSPFNTNISFVSSDEGANERSLIDENQSFALSSTSVYNQCNPFYPSTREQSTDSFMNDDNRIFPQDFDAEQPPTPIQISLEASNNYLDLFALDTLPNGNNRYTRGFRFEIVDEDDDYSEEVQNPNPEESTDFSQSLPNLSLREFLKLAVEEEIELEKENERTVERFQQPNLENFEHQIANSLQRRLEERKILHETWVNQHQETAQINKKQIILSIIAEVRRQLSHRLAKEESLLNNEEDSLGKRKIFLSKKAAIHQNWNELLKNCDQLFAESKFDDIISYLSWCRIWDHDTSFSFIEIVDNIPKDKHEISKQRRLNIIAAIKKAEISQLRERKFTRASDKILFTAQLPLETQISLAANWVFTTTPNSFDSQADRLDPPNREQSINLFRDDYNGNHQLSTPIQASLQSLPHQLQPPALDSSSSVCQSDHHVSSPFGDDYSDDSFFYKVQSSNLVVPCADAGFKVHKANLFTKTYAWTPTKPPCKRKIKSSIPAEFDDSAQIPLDKQVNPGIIPASIQKV